MTYITRENSVTDLPMSKRSINCLRRVKVLTIGAMLDYPIENLLSLRNIGQKSVDEIKNWILTLKAGDGEYVLIDCNETGDDSKSDQSITVLSTSILQHNSLLDEDIPVKDLPISIRAKNSLIKSGYEYASQIIGLTIEQIMAIPNMRRKTAEDLIKYIKSISQTEVYENKDSISLNSYDGTNTDQLIITFSAQDHELATELSEAYGETISYWKQIIASVKTQHPDILGESLIYRIYDKSSAHKHVKDLILSSLKNDGNIDKDDILSLFPLHLQNTTVVDEILIELENSSIIKIDDTTIHRLYPSLTDFVSQIEDERIREIIKRRLEGQTLVEIGSQYNISRAFTHQLMQKGLRKRPILRENKYIYIYDNYDFSEEDFTLAFEEPKETYYYLDMISHVSHSDKKPLEDILTDPKISHELKKQAERVIYKNHVFIDGIRIKKISQEIVKYMVKTYCKSLTRMGDFSLIYQEKLNELGLGDDPLFVIDSQTCANFIMGSNFALWNQWNSFRYYNIPEYDYSELFSTIRFDQFVNTEISTLKIFNDYPELMQQYDIHDEYELHNLLRKTWSQEICEIKFLRMPTIEIGNANREEQILSLLLQYAPISATELSEKYEELYGVKASTVRGSYLKSFNNYFFDGMYSIDYTTLPTIQFNRMKAILDRDYYMIQDVKRLYIREFPNSNDSVINPYTLKTLGFHVYPGYSGYIVKNTFFSATDYFNTLLTQSNIVDLNDYDASLRHLATFNSELHRLRNSYDIIEFSPLQYISISRLNEIGITRDHLNDYCKSVSAYFEKGEFFTIASIHKDGFTHQLDDLGFDDWFYSSILVEDRSSFSAQRIGRTRIFLRGKSNCNLSRMLTWLLEKNQKIDIYDLIELLKNHYGIILPKDKIIEVVNGTELYYDAIMEAVYIDYDTYFEEI